MAVGAAPHPAAAARLLLLLVAGPGLGRRPRGGRGLGRRRRRPRPAAATADREDDRPHRDTQRLRPHSPSLSLLPAPRRTRLSMVDAASAALAVCLRGIRYLCPAVLPSPHSPCRRCLAPIRRPAACAVPRPRPGAPSAARFHGRIAPIDPATRKLMVGVSWHRGCPVPLRDLRVLTLTHWGFDGAVQRGRLVVNRDAARPLLRAMRALFRLRFPIRSMHLVDAYGAGDHRSMAADNTSAFNCRFVAGTESLVRTRLRPRDRRQPGREPLRRRPGLRLAPRRRPLRRPRPARQGDDPRRRPGRARLRRRRLGLGRLLGLAQGLPALLRERALRRREPRQ